MVLSRCRTRRPPALLLVLLAGATLGRAVFPADAAPRAGEVTLALREYLDLVQAVETRDRERVDRERRRETPVAEIASQRTAVTVSDDVASVEQTFEVVLQGDPRAPVLLPLTGLAGEARVERLGSGAAGAAPAVALDGVAAGTNGAARLVATAAGRYRVTVRGRVLVPPANGVRTLALAPVLAPVAEAILDLPADMEWSCVAGVPVEDAARAERRLVRLALPRGASPSIDLRRKGDTAAAEELLAQSVTLTLFQLLPEGTRRFDLVLYEVVRGGLASMDVELPAGVVPDKVISDEGEALQSVEGGHLRVERRQQLRGTGYLLVASTPAAAAPLAIGTLRPAVESRARYVVVSSAVAAEAEPQPAAAWSRVDLDDLPATLRNAVGGLDLLAAWRQSSAAAASAALVVRTPPPASRLPTLVRTRETTTLLTPDGTLLFRDRLSLAQAGEALRLTLPAGAHLWSARVGDQPVTPLVQGGDLLVPLGLLDVRQAAVEIVAVVEQAVPAGRSRLALAAPRVAAPVLEHRWQLLLPDGARYRYAGGDLRPAAPVPVVVSPLAAGALVSYEELAKIPTARDAWAQLQATPGVLTDRVNVGGNETGQESAAGAPAVGGVLQVRAIDDRGEALPGVAFTLSTAQGQRTAMHSDAQGRAVLRIPAGYYTLRAELEGFSTVDWPNLLVSERRVTSIDVTLSAAVEDVITVTAETPLLDARRSGNTTTYSNAPAYHDFDAFGSKRENQARAAAKAMRGAAQFQQQAADLRQGLVGGVRPLPVSIPESGKALLLAGVLPPELVTVAIDVKRARR